jgi:hypothetical protein
MARRPRPGTICAYCGRRDATTWDHVFARKFFVVRHRGNLPQVPACDECNNAKAAEEHYLATALPFGGQHAESSASLALVERRLAQNQRLRRELASGMERDQGHLVVPLDTSRLLRLFEFIAHGLILYHWGTPLPPACRAKAMMLTPEGQVLFDQLVTASGDRVADDLGEGTFTYRGLRDGASPENTVWQFKVLGGLKFSDAGGQPTRIDVLTGSPEFLARIPE